MNIIEFLSSTFLFSGVDVEKCREMIESISPTVADFNRGNLIFDVLSEKKIGFVISGECEVTVHHSDRGVVSLNRISSGGSFGIISVFSEEEFPTEIYAKRQTRILFISKNDVFTLIEKSSEVSLNILKFLANKINFLNGRLSTFSGGSVEKKLANYLILELKKHGENSFPFNKKQSAEAIGSGRASLYRALEALECANLVKIYDKKILILDPVGLERTSK